MPSSATAAPVRAGAAPGALRPFVLLAASAVLLTGALLVLRPFSTDLPTSGTGVHYHSSFEMPPDVPLTAEAIDAAAATGASSSDLALAGYYAAACLLESPDTAPEAQEDGPIFALIDSAAARPELTVVAPNAPSPATSGIASPAPRNVSNAVVLLRVVKGLCRRAERHATEGDAHAAAACLDRTRAIATQILATEKATLEAQQAVRTLDVLAARYETRVLTLLHQTDAARRADTRARLLASFWHNEATPALMAARGQRDALMRTRADLALSEATDRGLAVDLMRRYAAARVSAASSRSI